MSPYPDLGGPLGLRLLGECFGVGGFSAGWTAALNRKRVTQGDDKKQKSPEDPTATWEQDSGWDSVCRLQPQLAESYCSVATDPRPQGVQIRPR